MGNKRLTFRLYPTKLQKEKLFYARKLHQLLYDACIAHRRFEWRKNRKNVDYFIQQNPLPGFREQWDDYQSMIAKRNGVLYLTSLQATVKRVDLAYNAFFKGIRKFPKFKAIRNYSGWTYPDLRQGFKVTVESSQKYVVNCGWVTLNDLGIRVRMRGRFKYWGKPTTCTIVYRPNRDEWYVSFRVVTDEPVLLFGSESPLDYESMVAFDLGTETAFSCR